MVVEIGDVLNTIMCGDVLERLRELPDGSVDCIITSPPYWGLRNYGVLGQLGIENTVGEYVTKMVEIFRECKRVLADYGTLWLNLGDTYNGSMRNKKKHNGSFASTEHEKGVYQSRDNNESIQNKSLCMVPETIAIALIQDSWVLRNKIIWHKPSMIPQSAHDRFTNDHEMIYFFTKRPKGYYFEQQFEPITSAYGLSGAMRNRRCVWKISSQAVKESHFATFPFRLIETPIRAGCPELVCMGKKSPATRVVGFECRETPHRRDKTKGVYWAVKDVDRTITSETLIDGCGEPVRPEIEKKSVIDAPITENEKECPDNHFLERDGRAHTELLSRSLTTATHCSCGAPFRRGIVLDPFMGSGTTAIVARALGRDFIGIELNQKYIEIAYQRLAEWPPEKVLKKLNGNGKKTRRHEDSDESTTIDDGHVETGTLDEFL